MRIKPKQLAQVLSISDRSPEVVHIFGDVVIFKAFVNLDVQAAIESGIVTCDFKILNDKKLETKKIKVSSLESRSAMSIASKRKNTSISKSNNVVSMGKIDVTQHIANDKILSILKGAPAKRQKIIKLVNNLDNDSSSIRPIDSSLSNGIEKNDNLTLAYSIDLIHRKGKDPAAEINSSHFHNPVSTTIRGFATTTGMSRLSGKAIQFRKSFMQNNKTSIKVKLEHDDQQTVEVPFRFKMSKGKVSFYSVEINAMKESTTIRQTIKFDLDLQRAYEDYLIPTIAPKLFVMNAGMNRIVKIQQADKRSDSVEVFRRIVTDRSGESPSPFTKIANIRLSYGAQSQFVDRAQQPGKCIYRAIPINELSITSGEFSSVVVSANITKKRKAEPDTLTVLATESDKTVSVAAYNIPNDIVALRLVRKNLSTHESSFSSPSTINGGPFRSFNREISEIQYKDAPTRPDTIYEYKLIMIDAYGDERESQLSSIIRFSGDLTAQGGRALTIQQPQSSADQMSKVTFQIDAPTDDASLDKIYSILTDAGLDSQYIDEIKQNRELLSSISAIELLRFDVTSGLNESFGVVKTGVFEDGPKSRRVMNVSTLIPGRTYIYQFRLLLRLASTIFNNINLEQTDLESGKTYTTNLKKFNSPNTLNRGILASSVKQSQAISKTGIKKDASSDSNSEMIEGRTALTGQVSVQLPSKETTLSNISVEETTRGNVIRWNIIQGNQHIDHIIIFAEYNGRRAPLRAVHYSGRSKMVYLDDRLEASSNEVLYFVSPVFTDFKQGGLLGPAEA